MFNHKNVTNLSKGSLSNVDFLILLLHFNGPLRSKEALGALRAWRGKDHRSFYTKYFSASNYNPPMYVADSFTSGPDEYYPTGALYYKVNNRWHLTVRGIERLARILSTLT